MLTAEHLHSYESFDALRAVGRHWYLNMHMLVCAACKCRTLWRKLLQILQEIMIIALASELHYNLLLAYRVVLQIRVRHRLCQPRLLPRI